jgi:hypothetical protein
MNSALHVRRALKRKDSLDQKKPASSDALARTMVPGQVHTGMDSYTRSVHAGVNPCLESRAPSSAVPLPGQGRMVIAHRLRLGGLLHLISVDDGVGQQHLKPASVNRAPRTPGAFRKFSSSCIIALLGAG